MIGVSRHHSRVRYVLRIMPTNPAHGGVASERAEVEEEEAANVLKVRGLNASYNMYKSGYSTIYKITSLWLVLKMLHRQLAKYPAEHTP